MIQRGSIVKLNNEKEYVVISMLTHENNDYLYLTNMEDKKDYMFCKKNGNNLDKVTDGNLIEKLLLLFASNIR